MQLSNYGILDWIKPLEEDQRNVHDDEYRTTKTSLKLQSILHFLSGGGEDVVECIRKKMIYYILHSEILSAQV